MLIAALSLLAPLPARAELKLPAVLGDHMVLQQGTAAVWGWAKPGSTITVALAGKTGTGVTGEDGRWNVLLVALEAGGPYDMHVSGDGALTVLDVLVGDVWLGAGQSNMEVLVRAARDGQQPISAAECDQIRLFTVERAWSLTPVDDTRGAWQVCTQETARAFSAVGYYFAREIHAASQVPLGIVVSAWGATSIHLWSPSVAPAPGATIASSSFAGRGRREGPTVAGELDFDLSLKDLRFIPRDKHLEAVPVLLQAGGAGLGGNWTASAKERSTAEYAAMSSTAARKGGAVARFSGTLRGAEGKAVLSTPLAPEQMPVDLTSFEAIAFSAKGRGEFRVTLGQASIGNVDDNSAQAFPLAPEWSAVQLPMNAFKPGGWSASKAFSPAAVTSVGFVTSMPEPRAPGVVYNGMIQPLTPLRLRGVIWYQGEADTKASARYDSHLATLIHAWREAWRADELPFLVVQLPSYGGTPSDPADGWAQLREAQRQILMLPKTALITTIDLGDAVDIHPKNKTDVGKRLALAAERLVYGKAVVASGPVLDGLSKANGRIRLRFKETGGGIVAKDGTAVSGFSVSADGRQFKQANARILDPTTVEVWSDEVPNPVEVRYAWANDPVCNLFNREGLPASPFRAAVNGTIGAANGAPSAARAPTPAPLR